MAEIKFDKFVKQLDKIEISVDKVTASMEKLHAETVKIADTGIIKLIDKTKVLKTANQKLTESQKQQIKIEKEKQKHEEKLNLTLQKEIQLKKQQEAAVRTQAREEVKLVQEKKELVRLSKIEVKSDKDLIKYNNLLARSRSRLTKNSKANRKEYSRLTREIQKNEKVIRSNDKSIGRFQRNVGNYKSGIKGLAASFGLLGGAMIAVNVIRNAFNTFKEFSKEQSRLAAILGTTTKGVSGLTNQAKQLGSVTAFTASEITSLQIELAKLGFTQKQIEDSTKGIQALAAATGVDLAEAAKLTGATLKIFNLKASESAKVADTLALSTSKSALDMSKLSTALPIVGKTANLAGVSLNRTVALLGKLSDNGLDASRSATGLRNIFLELSKKGITWEQAMKKINNATDKNKTSMELFGKRSAAVGVILAESKTSVDDLTEALNDGAGAAQDMADVMLDNLSGDITLAQSAWEGFILSVADGSGEISKNIRSLVQGFTGLLQSMTDTNTASAVLEKKFGMKFWGNAGFFHTSTYKELGNLVVYLEKVKSSMDGLSDKKRNNELKQLLFNIKSLKLQLSQEKSNSKADVLIKRIELYQDYYNQIEKAYREKKKLDESDKKTPEELKKIEEENKRLAKQAKLLRKKQLAQDLADFKERQKLELTYYKLQVNDEKRLAEFKKQQKIELLQFQLTYGKELNNVQKQIIKNEIKLSEKDKPEIVNSFIPNAKDAGVPDLIDENITSLFNTASQQAEKQAKKLQKKPKFNFLKAIFGGGENAQQAQQAILDIFHSTFDMINTIYDANIQKIEDKLALQDEEIAKTQEELDAELNSIKEQKKARQGYDLSRKKALEDKLRDEKAARFKTLQAEKELHLKQQRMQVAQATMDMASGIMDVWGSKGPVWLKIIESAAVAATGAVQIVNIKTQHFAEGTEFAQLNGNPPGTDTIPAMINEGEGIIPTKINKGIPYNKGFKHWMIPAAAEMFLNGNYYNDNSETNKYLKNIDKNTQNNIIRNSEGRIVFEKKGNHFINYN